MILAYRQAFISIDSYAVLVLWIVLVLALFAVLLGAAAWNDLTWRRRGFRTEIRGKGRTKQKVRVRIDPTAKVPENPDLVDQDWVRMGDYEEPDAS
jgi:hypothetical protein